MKKIVLAAAAIAVTASASYGASIVNTKHDLMNGLGGLTGGSQQLCVYCHTPHNPLQNIPLWNRNANATITNYYNQSATITTDVANATISSSSISGFCMSCHDGTTSMGNVSNKVGATDAGTVIGATSKANLGLDLSNDHPVGFSYANAAAEDTTGLHDALTATGNLGSTAFFTTAAGADQMECASCHKVHDNAASPFLRLNNAGSNLCLACHNK